MAYVYRYTDLADNIIKYVGIVWSDNGTLRQRINEHTKDEWYTTSQWKIEYFEKEVKTRTDAEFLESHFISLYETDKWFNNKKSGWGISNFLLGNYFEWQTWNEEEQKTMQIDSSIPFPNSETINNIQKISFYLKENEYETIVNNAKNNHLSLSNYIRKIISTNNNNYFSLDDEKYCLVDLKDVLLYFRNNQQSQSHFYNIIQFPISGSIQHIDCFLSNNYINLEVKENDEIINTIQDSINETSPIFNIAINSYTFNGKLFTKDITVIRWLISYYSSKLSITKNINQIKELSELLFENTDETFILFDNQKNMTDRIYFHLFEEDENIKVSVQNRTYNSQHSDDIYDFVDFIDKYSDYYYANNKYSIDNETLFNKKLSAYIDFNNCLLEVA